MLRSKKLLLVVLLFVFVVMTGCGGSSSSGGAAYNATGTLDTTFSTDGAAVAKDPAGGTDVDDSCKDLAVDSNGKIIAVGDGDNASGNVDLIVLRYNRDGTLDTTFSGDGIAIGADIAGGTNGVDRAYSVAIDSNNKILVSGQARSAAGNNDVVTLRYNTDGTLDTTFSTDGVAVATDVGGAATTNEYGEGVAVDSNDKVIVTGYSGSALGSVDLFVLRYNTDGTLDTTFSGDGIVLAVDVAGGTNTLDQGYSVAIDSNDKAIVTGYSVNALGDADIIVMRYLTDGTLDTTFSGDGIAVQGDVAGGTDVHDYAYDIVIDSNDKVLVTGYALNAIGNYDIVVLRYLTDGTLDTSFSADGIAVTANAAAGPDVVDYGFGITVDARNRPLVTGYGLTAGGNGEIVVLRYNTDGTLDTTFDSDGIVVVNDPAGEPNATDNGEAIAVDSSGRIFVGGYAGSPTADDDMVVIKLK